MSARTHSSDGAFAPEASLFVTDADQQRMIADWQEQTAQTRVNAKKANGKPKEKLKVISSEINAFHWRVNREILEFPLLQYIQSDLDEQPVKKLSLPVRVFTDEDLPKEYAWSDEDIYHLHEKLLEYAYRILASKGNAEEKFEFIQWIWAPDIYKWVNIKVVEKVEDKETGKTTDVELTRRLPLYRRSLPFTFLRCCAFTGQHPEDIRKYLANKLRHVLKELGLNYIIKQEGL